MKRNNKVGMLLAAPFIVITAMIILASVNVIVQSFGYIPAFDLYEITPRYYIEVMKRPEFLKALGVSLRISIISTIGAAVIGTILCAALVKLRKTRGGMLYIVRLPILVPHTVVAVFTLAIFSQTGIIARLAYTAGMIGDYTDFPLLLYSSNYVGVIVAYLWKEIPFIAYFTMALMSSVNDTLGEAAENLGASPLRSFWHITLPLSLPAIAKATLIVFIFAFGAFDLPFLLGATTPKALPIYTYIDFIKPNLKDRPYAMAMNGITLIISLVMAVAYWLLMKRLTKKLGGK